MELLISSRSHENGEVNSVRCNLDGELTLGRGPESILRLDGTGMSREHLKVHAQSEAIFITDLSSNGTWLNTRRLTRGEPHPVTAADEIRLPGFELRIEMQRTTPAAPSQSGDLESIPPGGPLALVSKFGASLSQGEKLLAVLALGTLSAIVLYLLSA